MSNMLPAAVYGLQVPKGDLPIPACPDFPATFRITMAAIDPSALVHDNTATWSGPPRATLKIMRVAMGDRDSDEEESDEDDDDIEAIKARLAGLVSDDEDSDEESDEEENGGPSDPSKTKMARQKAMFQALLDATADGDEDDDEDMEDAQVNGVNGVKLDKGKGKATDDEEDSDDDSSEEYKIQEFVLCTLDPSQNYQQPLDITVGEKEQVFFKVHGTHDIFLTGNYVLPPEDDYDSSDDEDFELASDEVDSDLEDVSSEDELDDLEDPRVMEVGSDEESEEEAPKLIKAADGKPVKGKNKRVASDSYEEKGASLDDLINKSLKPDEEKPSKKQAKKLKNNAGQAVATAGAQEEKAKDKKDGEATKNGATNGKKVSFAKNLEQGPTPSAAKPDSQKTEKEKESKDKGGKLGIKVVQGVKIDDRKIGEGRPAKKGDKVGMRYIGKLEKNGKVFDSNKKGTPFKFKLGVGEVIKGWDIGVAGLQVGGERKIHIPANLAYGSKGAPPDIPANSNLVFEIKMISLE